jgi:hypothetical protein
VPSDEQVAFVSEHAEKRSRCLLRVCYLEHIGFSVLWSWLHLRVADFVIIRFHIRKYIHNILVVWLRFICVCDVIIVSLMVIVLW